MPELPELEIVREVLARQIGFLEELFPRCKGTHVQEMRLLREPIADPGEG